mgnify:CR=1 FL=1
MVDYAGASVQRGSGSLLSTDLTASVQVDVYGGTPAADQRRLAAEARSIADELRRLAGEIDTGLMRVPEVPLGFLEALHRRFFARVRPSVTGVLAGPGGEAWVRRFDAAESWEGHARTWDRAAWEGPARGPKRLPPRFRPLRIADGLVYGIAFDDDYVDRVEVYRLSETGAP